MGSESPYRLPSDIEVENFISCCVSLLLVFFLFCVSVLVFVVYTSTRSNLIENNFYLLNFYSVFLLLFFFLSSRFM